MYSELDSSDDGVLHSQGNEACSGVERVLPEQVLWKAVICRAFADAVQGSRKARDWLLTDVEDFVMVCSLAGVSPVTVRSAASRMMKLNAINQ